MKHIAILLLLPLTLGCGAEATAPPESAAVISAQAPSKADETVAASATAMTAPLPTIPVCELLSAADVASVMGEIKEGPTTSTALRGEARCGYTNMEGSWVTWSYYGAADRWEWEKGINNDKTSTVLSGLGDEAFTFQRGTDSVVLARKQGTMLEVNCSCGAAKAEAIARKVAEKL